MGSDLRIMAGPLCPCLLEAEIMLLLEAAAHSTPPSKG